MKDRKYWAKKKIALDWKSYLNLDVRADITVISICSTLRYVSTCFSRIVSATTPGEGSKVVIVIWDTLQAIKGVVV